MYYVCSENAEGRKLFGISNETRQFACFTDKYEEAEEFAQEMNRLDVDEIHIYDIIEDRFYSGCY